jgi:hypothetical protein
MKRLLLAAAAAITLIAAAVPASAQFYAGVGPGGAGVQLGPVGAGIGPAYGWHDPYWRGDRYAYYAGDCRVIRERTITAGGEVFYTTRRVCD